MSVEEIDRRKFGAVNRSPAQTATPAAALSRTTTMVLAFLRIKQTRGGLRRFSGTKIECKFGAFSGRAKTKALSLVDEICMCFDSEQPRASKRKRTETIPQDS